MRFVVDETSWIANGLNAPVYIDALEQMLDRIDEAVEGGHACWYSDDLFNMPILGGRTFYELYEPGTPISIPRDLQVRVAVAFNRLPVWQDRDDWPPAFEATIGSDEPFFAPSIAWAHARSQQSPREAVACISHTNRHRNGLIEVVVVDQATLVWFISTSKDAEDFFRWLIIRATGTPEELEALSPFAFPELGFVKGCFGGIKGMSKPYEMIAPVIVRHLSALADDGRRVFSGRWQDVEGEFGGLGVTISDENGATKSNNDARRARTIEYKSRMRTFWWHTKLEPHQDRIHLCPDEIRNGGQIIVGIFCKHLTT